MRNDPQTTYGSVVDVPPGTEVIHALNMARSMELHALSQYMDHHYSLEHLDYGEFAANLKLIAIDEMRHAERFGERVKALGGAPTYTVESPVQKGQAVDAIFIFDINLESHTMAEYNRFKTICIENDDSISAQLFETIIAEELEHYNYFGNVAGHIDNLGNTYLAKLAGTPSSTGPASKGFVGFASSE